VTSRPRDPDTSRPDYVRHFLQGVSHFNSREFWDAHESWETIWLEAETLDQFLQGLIQIAAAYHHIQRGTFRGAVRLFDAALKRLEPFPMHFSGVDRSAVDAASRRHREWVASLLERDAMNERLEGGDFPALVLLPPEESPIPPFERW
jgi:predicted metal-dependent hydrolase